MTKLKKYPSYVCHDCGLKAKGAKTPFMPSMFIDKCEVCNKRVAVTSVKEFGSPEFEGFVKNKNDTSN